ncbi:hypothetical protein ADK67_19010 [Saccharothrix sp. NRRL B-16348]|nr:hypothetical protein ADK67_19010 [Saccharothrix sp. NRRL B-16348]
MARASSPKASTPARVAVVVAAALASIAARVPAAAARVAAAWAEDWASTDVRNVRSAAVAVASCASAVAAIRARWATTDSSTRVAARSAASFTSSSRWSASRTRSPGVPRSGISTATSGGGSTSCRAVGGPNSDATAALPAERCSTSRPAPRRTATGAGRVPSDGWDDSRWRRIDPPGVDPTSARGGRPGSGPRGRPQGQSALPLCGTTHAARRPARLAWRTWSPYNGS